MSCKSRCRGADDGCKQNAAVLAVPAGGAAVAAVSAPVVVALARGGRGASAVQRARPVSAARTHERTRPARVARRAHTRAVSTSC